MAKGDVTLTLKANVAQYMMKIMQAENATTKMGKAAGDAARKQTKGFKKSATAADRAVKGVGRMVAQYVSAAAAIGLMTRALAAASAESERSRAAAEGAFPAFARLAQMAGGDAKEFKRLKGQVYLSMEQGMADDAAADLQFVLRSSGMEKHRAMFAGMVGGVTDIPELARSIAGMKEGMPEAGGARKIFNQAMIAQRLSTRAGAPEVLQGASRAAASARQLGITPAELMTLTAIVSQVMPTERAGTALNRLFTVGIAKGFEGRGMEFLTDLESRGLTAKRTQDYLGNVFAARAFGQYTVGRGDFAAALPDVIAGGGVAEGGDEATRLQAIVAGDPVQGATLRTMKAKGSLEVARLTRLRTLRAQEWERIRSGLEERAIARDWSPARTGAQQWGLRLYEAFAPPETWAERNPEEARDVPVSREYIDALKDFTEALKRNTDATETATNRMGAGQTE